MKQRVLPCLLGWFLIASASLSAADFEELSSRLAEEPDSPVAGELLVEAISSAPTVAAARRVYTLYNERLSTEQQRLAVYRELGFLEELAGNFDGALKNYEQLLEIDPEDDELRLRAAAAAMETGNYDRVRRHSQYVIDSARDRRAQRMGGLFLALSHLYDGSPREGLPLFRSLTRGDSRRTVESRTLVFALLAARAWEEEEYAAELEAKLERLYPATLDRLAVSQESAVSLAPRPSILLPAAPWEQVPRAHRSPGESEPSAEAVQGDSALPSDQKSESEEALAVGIQTGSFTDESNALVMRDEIREEGIPAQVREVLLGERRYYRVVVPTDGPVPAAEAQELVVRLKELGVEGFLLFAEGKSE